MKIFLDFDDVIFNTKSFFEKLKRVYIPFGISSEVFETTYQELKKEQAENWIGYSSDVHIAKLQENFSVDKQELQKAIKSFVDDTREFVFPDVKDFLQWAKKNAYSVSVLSFGNQEFQTQKIQSTKLSDYFEKIIVTDKDKSEALLAENMSPEKTWFFDDRNHFLENVKTKIPSIQTILVSRPEGRYADECGSGCDRQISSLAEGRDVIENSL